MAVTQNPITGKSAQKFGNAVFSSWKGINTLRTKPLSVANPRSEGQVEQRTKFAKCVLVARQALEALKLGFRKLAIKKSEYNVFISKNIGLASDLPNEIFADKEVVSFSQGNLDVVPIQSVAVLSGTIVVTFSTTTGNPLDKINLVIVDNVGGEVIMNLNSVLRSTGTISITNPNFDRTDAVAYLFASSSSKEVSNTTSIQVTT